MMGFTPAQRYYLSREPADMRKSFDGLSGLVRQGLSRDPLSGEVFIFLNRRRTMIKILVWDRSGFVIWSKRLERGTFELPSNAQAGASVALSWEELVMILEGVSLNSVHRRKRYSREKAAV
ncbi:MAG: IS66 family insertion sequence element accessory protein TnpB [Lewinellaceae bacterium]|nr:IS66 family insertion sequence element accessory protein TnpB [Lewinellaceae bacterium]